MNGQHRLIRERPPELGSNRESNRIVLQRRRGFLDPTGLPDRDQHSAYDRTAARQERAIACLVELLEARSVPSALGHLSFTGLVSAIQITPTDLANIVMPPSNIGEQVVLPSSNLPARALPVVDVIAAATDTVLDVVNSGLNLIGSSAAPALPVEGVVATATGTMLNAVNSGINAIGSSPVPALPIGGVVATATGTVLDAVNSGLNLGGATPGPVLPKIDVDLGSHVVSAGNKTSGAVEASLAPVVSSIPIELGSPVDGQAALAQAVSIAPDAGSVAIPTAAQGATALGAVSSKTGASGSVTISSLVGGFGDDGAAARSRRMDAPVLAGPSSLDPKQPTSRDTAPAELSPADLESLERALGQLMRQFDEIGADLANWLKQIGTLEMLLAAGLVGLACELARRWERRRRLTNPHTQFGCSNRPGPFYRRKACPFAVGHANA
jgi:hypothetical protein